MKQTDFIKKLLSDIDEKKLIKMFVGLFLGFAILLTNFAPFVWRAVGASIVIGGAFALTGVIKEWLQTFKFIATIFLSIIFWHYAGVWLGSGWWGITVLIVLMLGYRAYKMRAWVRLWWINYKANMKKAWNGEKN